MYKCFKCGQVFDEPERILQPIEWFEGTPHFQFDLACPVCHAVDEFGSVELCEICDEYKPDAEINEDYKGRMICDDCMESRAAMMEYMMGDR